MQKSCRPVFAVDEPNTNPLPPHYAHKSQLRVTPKGRVINLRMAKTYPTTALQIISLGSIELNSVFTFLFGFYWGKLAVLNELVYA